MKKIFVAATAIAMIGAPAASAQGLYVDGGYSFISISDDDLGVDFDLGAIGGHFGYDFNANFGVEGEVMVGVNDEEFSDGFDSASLGLNYALGAYGKVQAPIGEQIRVFARAGLVQAELEADVTLSGFGSASESSSETGAGYGVGAIFEVNDKIFVRGDYTRYDIEDVEADAFMIGLGVTF